MSRSLTTDGSKAGRIEMKESSISTAASPQSKHQHTKSNDAGCSYSPYAGDQGWDQGDALHTLEGPQVRYQRIARETPVEGSSATSAPVAVLAVLGCL